LTVIGVGGAAGGVCFVSFVFLVEEDYPDEETGEEGQDCEAAHDSTCDNADV
jgi:hypothetical protein